MIRTSPRIHGARRPAEVVDLIRRLGVPVRIVSDAHWHQGIESTLGDPPYYSCSRLARGPVIELRQTRRNQIEPHEIWCLVHEAMHAIAGPSSLTDEDAVTLFDLTFARYLLAGDLQASMFRHLRWNLIFDWVDRDGEEDDRFDPWRTPRSDTWRSTIRDVSGTIHSIRNLQPIGPHPDWNPHP